MYNNISSYIRKHKSGSYLISKKNLLLQLLNFTVLFFLLILSYFTWEDIEFHANWDRYIATISIGLLVYHIAIFRPLEFKMWEFRTWFILLSYLFMFGRVYLHGFNLDDNMYWDLSYRFPKSSLYQAGLIILCNLQAFYIGFSFQRKKRIFNDKKKNFLSEYSEKAIYKIVFSTGIFLILFSIPFRLYEDIRAIIITQTSSTYTELTNTIGFTNDLEKLFIPGIIYLIVGLSLKNYNIAKAIIVIMTLYLLSVMILTGDRREQTIAIIVIWLCYIVSSKIKINWKKLILWSVLGLVFLDVLTTISTIRQGSLTSVPEFINYYVERDRENTIFYSILSGFGLTFFSVVGIVEHIPNSIPYQWGLGFYGAIPSLLPVGWLFGDFFSTVSISPYVINRITGYPVGASLLGDLYANFGMLSILVSIFAGILLTKIFTLEEGKRKALFIAIYFSLFYILINWVRGSFFESFRPTFIVLLIPLIIIFVLKNRMKVKRE